MHAHKGLQGSRFGTAQATLQANLELESQC